MAQVQFQHVYKTYDDGTQALVDFDLQVQDGEFMVLVGSSGCGKSTALRLLAGLETLTAGNILIDDDDINDKPPQQRNIAMVFQNYALYPHMTVRQNLAFPLKMMKRGRADTERRVQQAAALLELTALLERKPGQLSGGQRQRVAMGRAIVREPRVFLMDEPLSNLDARLRVSIRADIAGLQKKMGTTTLYVTHDQVEAMTLGERVAVMNEGRLQQLGAPQDLYEKPANTFVAGFIGNPGMNLFSAQLAKVDNRIQVMLGDYKITVSDTNVVAPDTLASCTGQDLIVGLRPESFIPGSGDDDTLPARISSVETLGHEQLIYFTAPWSGGKTLVARQGSLQHIAHHEVLLKPDTSQLYFFTAEGVAIY
ncbi:MAG: sn-glycerol-3-phosphate ABC transporter ATP-binding protein UgpC [Gammaproteobacteria bacterium]|nr:MAG: sn-glycerol-3-phosphate ABC transporter ATP-binding protein UgpC [Gammaproteobacteria bacterium]